MSKVPAKTNSLLLPFFAKPHLVKFLLIVVFSNMKNFHIEVEYLRSIFKCNNYPVNIIDPCIKKIHEQIVCP